MLLLDDPRWTELEGGYRAPYDPRPAFARLRKNDDAAWDELWQELHHQGDVGLASYAAAPHLIAIHRERDIPNWQTYALMGTIELCRTQHRNPKLPDWLADAYSSALRETVALGCRDLTRTEDQIVTTSILGAIAISKGLRSIGEILLDFTPDEFDEMITLYRDR